MSIETAGLSLCWKYPLEEILGLVIVAAVAGLYSLMFAVTERNRGWLAAACLLLAATAAMVAVSPRDALARSQVPLNGKQGCR